MNTELPMIGLILAGGLSRRMGEDKASLKLQGQTLLHRAIERLRPQLSPPSQLLISSNHPLTAPSDIPQLSDSVEGFAGPLAGILTGLEWMQSHLPSAHWLVSVAVDTPFFPTDLIQQLASAGTEREQLICARSQQRLHPTFALWHRDLAPLLRRYLVEENGRRLMTFVERNHGQAVDFDLATSAHGPSDPFFNINTPQDLEQAETTLT